MARAFPLLLAVAALGCTPLAWRGRPQTSETARFDPNGFQRLPPVSSQTAAPPNLSAQSLPRYPETGRAHTADRPVATAPAGASVQDLTAFLQDLEKSKHVDQTTRDELFAEICRTPADLQPRKIEHYRSLLALGQSAQTAPAREPASRSQPQVSQATLLGSPPSEPPAPAADSSEVVAAAHHEPVSSSTASAAATEKESAAGPSEKSSDVSDELIAMLQKMTAHKAEAAAYTMSSPRAEKPADSGSPRNERRPPADADWQEMIEAAIEDLEAQIEGQLDSRIAEEDEARLRLLYLIAGRRDDAVRTIDSLEPEMQEFWSKQCFGLATLLNPELISDRSNRLIESKRNLDEALRRLGESSPLFVHNLAFITDVQSYGSQKPFDTYEFRPGQAVILYAEVENYRCKETPRGYHTALRSSYEIFDSRRQKVAEQEFQTSEEYCQNIRRDFFMTCDLIMPEKLYPGKYVLRLTIADLNGDKAGDSSITFHIRDAAEGR